MQKKKKKKKKIETLNHGYSSESTQRESSKNLCVLVFRTKVASALQGLNINVMKHVCPVLVKFNDMLRKPNHSPDDFFFSNRLFYIISKTYGILQSDG